MLRCVARRREYFDGDIAELDLVTVADRSERQIKVGLFGKYILGVRRIDQGPPGGNVVGVDVCVDHIVDVYVRRLRGLKVSIDISARINEGDRAFAAASEHV